MSYHPHVPPGDTISGHGMKQWSPKRAGDSISGHAFHGVQGSAIALGPNQPVPAGPPLQAGPVAKFTDATPEEIDTAMVGLARSVLTDVLANAAYLQLSEVKGYERVEHGREELVRGYQEIHPPEPASMHELDMDAADRMLEHEFHPQQLSAATVPHPKTGYGIKAGLERRLARPEPGSREGPAAFDVRDYGDPRAVGFNSLANMLGKPAPQEPVRHVYRGMSLEEWNQAVRRGYIQSDKRGTIASWEGTNAATEPGSAVSYLPQQGPAVVAKIAVRPEDNWFTIHADNYLRTRGRIPLDRVEHISPVLQRQGKYGHLTIADDRVKLARSYERVEHGREELVHGYAPDRLGADWYHGSDAEFQPGDLIEKGHASKHGRPMAHTFFTGDPAAAAEWGRNVYEVEPTGRYERDPTAEVGGETGDHRSKYPLKVVRKLAESEYGHA